MVRFVLKNTFIGTFYIPLESYKLVEHNDVMILENYALFIIENTLITLKSASDASRSHNLYMDAMREKGRFQRYKIYYVKPIFKRRAHHFAIIITLFRACHT